jgi:DNA-binding response OmpR family regulator
MSPHPPPKAPRVLVAEDNPALRSLIADVLTTEGYEVVEAANAFELEQAIRISASSGATEAFDLVVTDIRMPGKSGLDALSELRRAGSESRFVVVTAFPEDATELRIRQLDAKLLAKPFSLGDFRALMKNILYPSVPTSGGGA